MTTKELIEKLNTYDEDTKVGVASDEEWNTVFESVDCIKESDSDMVVIFGLSGSERDDY